MNSASSVRSKKIKYERGTVGDTWERKYTKEFGGKPNRKKRLEELGVDGSLMLKCILKKKVGWCGLGTCEFSREERGRLL